VGKLRFVYVRTPSGEWVDIFDVPVEVLNSMDRWFPVVSVEVEDPDIDDASKLQDILRDLLKAKYGCGGG